MKSSDLELCICAHCCFFLWRGSIKWIPKATKFGKHHPISLLVTVTVLWQQLLAWTVQDKQKLHGDVILKIYFLNSLSRNIVFLQQQTGTVKRATEQVKISLYIQNCYYTSRNIIFHKFLAPWYLACKCSLPFSIYCISNTSVLDALFKT